MYINVLHMEWQKSPKNVLESYEKHSLQVTGLESDLSC